MNAEARTPTDSPLLGAVLAGLQWRLLVLWLVGLWLPTAIVAVPIMAALGHQLDHSMASASLATGFDTAVFADLLGELAVDPSAIRGAALLATALTLLLSPLLTGMAVATIRNRRQPGAAALDFPGLVRGGLIEYGRLLRMLLWAGLLMGAALVAGAALIAAVAKGADHAIVASEIEGRARWAWGGSIALFALVHASLEAGRAQLAADETARSAVRAWWRGCKQLVRRPLATLGSYLLISAIGYVMISGLARWRIGLPGSGGAGLLLAFAATQLISLASAWMRTARLSALAALGPWCQTPRS